MWVCGRELNLEESAKKWQLLTLLINTRKIPEITAKTLGNGCPPGRNIRWWGVAEGSCYFVSKA